VLRFGAGVGCPLLLMAVAYQPVVSPAAWKSRDAGDPTVWTEYLTDADRREIAAAVQAVKSSEVPREHLTRADFPLVGLAPKIDAWTAELRSGRGFVFVRGFPIDMPADDVELGWLGLGLHLGTPVSQDAHGSLLGHVRDRGVPRTSPATRLYATNERQDFHTDGADIIGLLCLHGAKQGGESRLASAAAVYNELLRRDPALIDTLRRPMCWDRNDEQSAGEPPFYELPVIRDVDGSPRIFYIGWYIRDAQRHAEVPRLTAAQRAAMDAIEAIANSPDFYVEMEFRPGDMQWLNNAVMLHSREAYVDFDEPERKRHLLRLWLSAHSFSSVEDALRAGIPKRQD
jgi:hypothetical protein